MMNRYPLPGVYQQDEYPKRRPPLRMGVMVFLACIPYSPMDTTITDETQQREYAIARQQFYRTPIEINSEAELLLAFPHLPENTFTKASIYGFFRNGGTSCYVVPVEDASSVDLTLDVLDELDDGDLISFPDLMWAYQDNKCTFPDVLRIQGEILAHCSRNRIRFAILDAVDDATDITAQRQSLIQQAGRYGALYYPWIKPANTVHDFIPPSGHIAGTYARTDYARGVHKAPANEPIHDVLDVSHPLSKAEQGSFVERRINYILAKRGRGIRAWGAYTLSTDDIWKYLTTSRLYCKIARWVNRFMIDVTFENNDIYLWTYIEGAITLYLFDLVEAGEITNYFVRCNEETNPPEDREIGIVRTQIGLAPTFPTEFIIITVMHGESGVSLRIENSTIF